MTGGAGQQRDTALPDSTQSATGSMEAQIAVRSSCIPDHDHTHHTCHSLTRSLTRFAAGRARTIRPRIGTARDASSPPPLTPRPSGGPRPCAFLVPIPAAHEVPIPAAHEERLPHET